MAITYCAEAGRPTNRPDLCPISVRCPSPDTCQAGKAAKGKGKGGASQEETTPGQEPLTPTEE